MVKGGWWWRLVGERYWWVVVSRGGLPRPRSEPARPSEPNVQGRGKDMHGRRTSPHRSERPSQNDAQIESCYVYTYIYIYICIYIYIYYIYIFFVCCHMDRFHLFSIF